MSDRPVGQVPDFQPVPASAPGAAPPDTGTAAPPRRNWRGPVFVTTLVAAAVALPFLLDGGGDAGRPGPDQAVATTTTRRAASSGRYVAYRDDQGRFSIQRPEGWTERPLTENNRLRVSSPDGTGAILVRVDPADPPVAGDNPDEIRRRADLTFMELLKFAPTARTLQSEPVTVNGLPGYHYLYTITVGDGREAVHLQYFLYRGDRVYMVVFEALPRERLEAWAPTFERVLHSFRVDPDAGAPPATTATTTR